MYLLSPHGSAAADGGDLLPSNRFTPRSMLGAGNSDREMLGHLFASQIANLITTKNPDEDRTLVLGLGLGKEAAVEMEREAFLAIVDLVLRCI
jgi:proteasome assembly chaperone 3